MYMNEEEKNIAEVIKAARTIQEFLWSDMNQASGLEEFKRMFRKRVAKLDSISIENPHWKVELRKRLLQVTAIAVNLLRRMDNDSITSDDIHPTLPSNLPEYEKPLQKEKEIPSVDLYHFLNS